MSTYNFYNWGEKNYIISEEKVEQDVGGEKKSLDETV